MYLCSQLYCGLPVVLPTFVNKLDSNNSSKSCARGWRHVSYLLASRLLRRVSLLVCFHKIIFKDRVNCISKTRYYLKSFYLFCFGAM